jgi:hypothetical protein
MNMMASNQGTDAWLVRRRRRVWEEKRTTDGNHPYLYSLDCVINVLCPVPVILLDSNPRGRVDQISVKEYAYLKHP